MAARMATLNCVMLKMRQGERKEPTPGSINCR